jgi:hypothetical protein
MKEREYLVKAILKFFPELELKIPKTKFKVRDKIIYETMGGVLHGWVQEITQEKHTGRWFYHVEIWHPETPKSLLHHHIAAEYLEGDLEAKLRK